MQVGVESNMPGAELEQEAGMCSREVGDVFEERFRGHTGVQLPHVMIQGALRHCSAPGVCRRRRTHEYSLLCASTHKNFSCSSPIGFSSDLSTIRCFYLYPLLVAPYTSWLSRIL